MFHTVNGSPLNLPFWNNENNKSKFKNMEESKSKVVSHIQSLTHTLYEPVHDKTYKICVTSRDSDKPSLDSLAVEVTRSVDWSDCSVQADLNLCWSHTSYCRFCRALNIYLCVCVCFDVCVCICGCLCCCIRYFCTLIIQCFSNVDIVKASPKPLSCGQNLNLLYDHNLLGTLEQH